MLARVQSFVLSGIDDGPCEVEVDIADVGLPRTTVVGLPDAAVRESVERVQSAVRNSGYPFPDTPLLVNLAPADLRKEGPIYDLPIAIGLLIANGTIRPPVKDTPIDYRSLLFAGVVALDGRLRAINGAISLAIHAKRRGMRGVVLPADNAREAAAVGGIEVFGASTLAGVVSLLSGEQLFDPENPVDFEELVARSRPAVDMADIKGQEAAKRAMIIAVAGGHNILAL